MNQFALLELKKWLDHWNEEIVFFATFALFGTPEEHLQGVKRMNFAIRRRDELMIELSQLAKLNPIQ